MQVDQPPNQTKKKVTINDESETSISILYSPSEGRMKKGSNYDEEMKKTKSNPKLRVPISHYNPAQNPAVQEQRKSKESIQLNVFRTKGP